MNSHRYQIIVSVFALVFFIGSCAGVSTKSDKKVTQDQAIARLQEMIKDSKTVYSVDDILPLYDQLDPVDLEFMIGTWKGGKFDGGKPDSINWYGKRFNSRTDVEPLLALNEDGTVYSFDKWGMAQMREVKFREKVSACLIYDQKPLMDYFRKVDENTVIGMGEMRDTITMVFYLVREK